MQPHTHVRDFSCLEILFVLVGIHNTKIRLKKNSGGLGLLKFENDYHWPFPIKHFDLGRVPFKIFTASLGLSVRISKMHFQKNFKKSRSISLSLNLYFLSQSPFFFLHLTLSLYFKIKASAGITILNARNNPIFFFTLILFMANLGIMRTVFGNQDRFEKTYFSKFPSYYLTLNSL